MSENPLLALFVSWIGWAGGFLLLYALQATGCRAGWDADLIGSISLLRLLLVATTAVIVLALLGLSWMAGQAGPASSLARIVAMTNGAAILATLCFTGVLWLRMCA